MSDERDPDDAGFDQTNGLAGDLEGESDGTAEGDEESVGDREQRGAQPFAADQLAAGDIDGDQGSDPNP